MLKTKIYSTLALALCLHSLTFASSDQLEEFKEEDDNVGHLWTEQSALIDYQLSTICSEEEKVKAWQILNSVDNDHRQTVLEDLQNFKKSKPQHFHSGIEAFSKLIDDGDNIFKSFKDFRFLLYTSMDSEMILSKNDLIARIKKYFDKQLTDEDNIYLINKPIVDLHYFGLLSVLLGEGNHTHQTFKILSQFIDIRQPEWNFNIILGRINYLTDIGLFSLGTSLQATFPFLSEPINDKIFTHILNVCHFYSNPLNDNLLLKIKKAVAQKNLKNEDDFRLYFDEQMHELVREGDIYQQRFRQDIIPCIIM